MSPSLPTRLLLAGTLLTAACATASATRFHTYTKRYKNPPSPVRGC